VYRGRRRRRRRRGEGEGEDKPLISGIVHAALIVPVPEFAENCISLAVKNVGGLSC
jgi:hypothetical protein